MRTIKKLELDSPNFSLRISNDFKVLLLSFRASSVCIWIETNTEEDLLQEHEFTMLCDEELVLDNYKHVASVVLTTAWHLYEIL